MTDAPPAAIYIRLDDELQARLDRYLAQLRKQQPNFRLTRSDAVRDLLITGLEVKEQAPRKGRGGGHDGTTESRQGRA